MFLHLPVSHSVHRRGGGVHPPGRHHVADIPLADTPSRQPRRSLQRTVCILLECILVSGVGPVFFQGGGGGQILRPKIADGAKLSEASHFWPGFIARLRALKGFGFLMLKYISLYRKIKQGPKMLNFGVKDGRVPGSPGLATVFTSRLS